METDSGKAEGAMSEATAGAKWVEPDWMKPFTEHLTNTGGWVTPEHAMNCRGAKDGCDSFSNSIRVTLCIAVQSQVSLLLTLHKAKLIPAAYSPERSAAVEELIHAAEALLESSMDGGDEGFHLISIGDADEAQRLRNAINNYKGLEG